MLCSPLMVLVSRPSCASLFLVANFVPHHLTLTVNKGETVHLSMQLLGSEKRDVTWKYNGRLSKTEERVESSKENNNCISTGFPRFFLAFFLKKNTRVFMCLVQETTITWLTGTKWSIPLQCSQWRTQLLPIKASTARATWGTPLSTGPGWGLLFEVGVKLTLARWNKHKIWAMC